MQSSVLANCKVGTFPAIIGLSQSGDGTSRFFRVLRVWFVFDVQGSVDVEGERFLFCCLYWARCLHYFPVAMHICVPGSLKNILTTI